MVTPPGLVEGMSMGKLVVGSDVGGLCELIDDGETGLLFRAGDVADLTRTLLRAIHDPALRRRAGERARAHVIEHCDARRLAGRYLEVYATARAERRVA
jgi:glycosyltransferase involved in cell wall biosynthesis